MARPKGAIIAGGQGTRIRSISGDAIPKALVPIAGEPIAARQLRLLLRYGVTQVAVLAGRLADKLREGLAPLAEQLGMELRFFVEEAPLGTAGGLAAARDYLGGDDFFTLYGDAVVDMDLQRLLAFHRDKGAAATVVVHPNDHPHESDLLRVDARQQIREVLPRQRRAAGFYRNLVPAAVYCFSPSVFEEVQPGEKQDFIVDVLPRLVRRGAAYAYNTREYLRDMGTVERYALAERDLHSGLVAGMHLSVPRPAVFFDRDGVLVPERGGMGLLHHDELELLPGAAEAVRLVNEAGRLAVVITNQPQLAKGLIAFDELDTVHAKLETLLGYQGAKLDRIYFCPHHPEAGFPGEVAALKTACACRKPQPGMIQEAARELGVLLDKSCMIGDTWRDVGAAHAAGIPAYGVQTALDGRDGGDPYCPDLVFPGVLEAVRHALAGPS